MIPHPDTFVDEFGEKADFVRGSDLRRAADALISHHARFHHLPQLRVEYLWKAKGGAKQDKRVFGKCQRPSGLLAFYAGVDFVIWLAADHCRDDHYDDQRIEALLFHEMLHIGWDSETDDAILVGHDFEGFTVEVQEYGFGPDLQQVRQIALFENVQEERQRRAAEAIDRATGEIREPHYHRRSTERYPAAPCYDEPCTLEPRYAELTEAPLPPVGTARSQELAAAGAAKYGDGEGF